MVEKKQKREEMVMTNGPSEGREKVDHGVTLDDKGSVASRWPGSLGARGRRRDGKECYSRGVLCCC